MTTSRAVTSRALFFRFFFMAFYGDAAAIVFHGDAAIGMKSDNDLGAVARHRLVDAIVDHFVNELVESIGMGIADVHPRPLSHRLETFQNSDRTCVVLLSSSAIVVMPFYLSHSEYEISD